MKLKVLLLSVAVGFGSLTLMPFAAKDGAAKTKDNVLCAEQFKSPKSRVGAAGVMAFLVRDIVPGSPAEQAGLRQGDIVLSLNGEQIDTINDFQQRIAESEPGTIFEIDYLRPVSGKLEEAKLKVKTAPSGSVYK